MVHKGHVVTEETFSFLLMGCIQDKKTGFRYALQVCAFPHRPAPSVHCCLRAPTSAMARLGAAEMQVLCGIPVSTSVFQQMPKWFALSLSS